MRKTKIVCTLGPATDDENVMRQLMLEGMSVARMNFSHGSHGKSPQPQVFPQCIADNEPLSLTPFQSFPDNFLQLFRCAHCIDHRCIRVSDSFNQSPWIINKLLPDPCNIKTSYLQIAIWIFPVIILLKSLYLQKCRYRHRNKCKLHSYSTPV